MGSDTHSFQKGSITSVFQSTLPAWGATKFDLTFCLDGLFQSTLPAWGATREDRLCTAPWNNFNPRSPHGERHKTTQTMAIANAFQSTLPAWGATFTSLAQDPISKHFNPRSPHGERHERFEPSESAKTFQSTLPAWGATDSDVHLSICFRISIHAPRMGSDSKNMRFLLCFCNFH